MKHTVRNIPFCEYAAMSDKSEYDYYLRYANIEPVDSMNIGAFDSCSFGFVKDVQDIMNVTGMTWVSFFEEMSKHLNTHVNVLTKLPIFDMQSQRLYVRDQVDMINKLEATALGHTPTTEEERAGIEVFNKYRSFCQIDKLMTSWPQYKLYEIRSLPYSLCFTKLMYEADKSEYEVTLTKIRSEKR